MELERIGGNTMTTLRMALLYVRWLIVHTIARLVRMDYPGWPMIRCAHETELPIVYMIPASAAALQELLQAMTAPQAMTATAQAPQVCDCPVCVAKRSLKAGAMEGKHVSN